jgi:hypothetical protein
MPLLPLTLINTDQGTVHAQTHALPAHRRPMDLIPATRQNATHVPTHCEHQETAGGSLKHTGGSAARKPRNQK